MNPSRDGPFLEEREQSDPDGNNSQKALSFGMIVLLKRWSRISDRMEADRRERI
jgi:hypothetical protein